MRRAIEIARIVRTPIHQEIARTLIHQRECWTEAVERRHAGHGGRTVAGAIIGGVVGHQLAKDSDRFERRAATAAGAITGGTVGKNVAAPADRRPSGGAGLADRTMRRGPRMSSRCSSAGCAASWTRQSAGGPSRPCPRRDWAPRTPALRTNPGRRGRCRVSRQRRRSHGVAGQPAGQRLQVVLWSRARPRPRRRAHISHQRGGRWPGHPRGGRSHHPQPWRPARRGRAGPGDRPDRGTGHHRDLPGRLELDGSPLLGGLRVTVHLPGIRTSRPNP